MAARAPYSATMLTTLLLVSIPGSHGFTPALKVLGSGYAALSTQHPLAMASVTAGGILCAADLST